MTEDEMLADLKSKIEAMAIRVETSDMARNRFGTPHVVIANGGIKPEGEPMLPGAGRTLPALIEDMLSAAKAERARIGGPAVLTWRAEPFIEREGDRVKVYMRFSWDSAGLAPAEGEAPALIHTDWRK